MLPLGASVRLTGTSIGEQYLARRRRTRSQVALPSLSTFDTSYAVEVRAAGFATRSSSLSALSCTDPPERAANGLQPGANVCTMQLTQLGRIPVDTRQISGDGTTIALSSVPVTATMSTRIPRNMPVSTRRPRPRTAPARSPGRNTQEGLVDGTYRIDASKTGYDDLPVRSGFSTVSS